LRFLVHTGDGAVRQNRRRRNKIAQQSFVL